MSRYGNIAGISVGSGGEIIIQSGLVLPPAINTNLNANTDNLSVPDLASYVLLRINSTGNYSLTGIVPPNITQGNLLFLRNVGTGNITLKDNDIGSTAENRFLMGGNRTVQPYESTIFVYDTIDLRWALFGLAI